MHIYRWDLDRTYLDTDIRSVRGMLRSALETASEKRNVPGADVLLRGLLAHDPDARAAILSGSPTQMRSVLEEKLALDGIRFDSLVLKDNLRNITRGRFRAVRGQLGYKLPRLLAHRLSEAPHTTESLFGDDAEVDALIYALYADLIAGHANEQTLVEVMRAGAAYDDQIEHALRSFRRIEAHDAVQDIWIHVDRGVPLRAFEHLGPRVHVVFSWFQAAISLWARGRLSTDTVSAMARRLDASPRQLAALAQDAVRRHLVDPDAVLSLVASDAALAELTQPITRAFAWMGDPPQPPTAPPSETRRYVDFLRASESFLARDGADGG